MNLVKSFGGKHGSIRVFTLMMDSLFFTGEGKQFDDDGDLNVTTESEESKSKMDKKKKEADR